ncbi:MAG: type II toxin-antitoxin system PrlF family antitoxin [Armatimonadetes bacterium]|nr:type II toxin-antitoxin system PrlF family antitoxin [Armatimonadota bacterium]
MPEATLTSKGQITLPVAIRKHLQVKPGDRVCFLIDDDGRVTVWPVTASVTSLKGIIPRPPQPVSLDDMEQAIQRRRRGK